MPTPAVGMFVATFPLLIWFNPFGIAEFFKNKWVIYLIIAFLCWLMVSNIRFFKLIPAKKGLAYMWPQLVLILIGGLSLIILKMAAIPIIFILYILLSIVYKHPLETELSETEIINHS